MDGSLSCTPEFQRDNEPEPVSGSPAEDEVLDKDTRQLISDFLKLYTGISTPRCHQSEALSTMTRAVDDLLDKYRYCYNGMRNDLQQKTLDGRGDDVSFIQTIARSTFSDGITSWVRIGCLLAFGATVCQYYMAEGREDCVERVAQEISTYLLSDQRDWLVRNNGWNGFVDFFTVYPESLVWNTLVAFVGLAGIAAAIAMVFYIIVIISVYPESSVWNTLMVFVLLAGILASLAMLIYISVQ